MKQVNPFLAMIKLLEQRLGRQQSALAETESQLASARESAQEWDLKQLELLKKAK